MLLDGASWKGLDGHLVGLNKCIASCATEFQLLCKIIVTLFGPTLDCNQAKAHLLLLLGAGILTVLDQFIHIFIYNIYNIILYILSMTFSKDELPPSEDFS